MLNKENGSRKTSVYSPVILNQKAKDVIGSVFDRVKNHAKLAGIKISDLAMNIEFNENKIIVYTLSFYNEVTKKNLVALDLDDFDMKFIEYLFAHK